MQSNAPIVADGASRKYRIESARRVQVLQRTYRRLHRRASLHARPLLLLWYLLRNLRLLAMPFDPALYNTQKR